MAECAIIGVAESKTLEKASSEWSLSDVIQLLRATVDNLQSEMEKMKAEPKRESQEALKEAELKHWSQTGLLHIMLKLQELGVVAIRY